MFEFPFKIITSKQYKQLVDSEQSLKSKASELFSNYEVQRGLAGTVLSSMNDGVLAVDTSGKIILINSTIEKLFHILEPEAIGKTVRQALLNNEISDLIEETLADKKSRVEEVNVLVPFKAVFEVSASPLVLSSKEIVGVVCVVQDMSEIRRLESYRTDFIANISHELKTPITAIKNYIETLLSGAIDDKAHNREFLAKIEKHANSLSALIEDVLEISSLETKSEKREMKNINLNKIISDAVEAVSGKALKSSIKIMQECEQGVNARGIEDLIYRAIVNLLSNSVSYSNPETSIRIICKKEGDMAIIEVIDQGIGIPEEHMPRIFERFYRIDYARSREAGGTGLGLAIVKHIMNLHNGEVSVQSVVGRGSTFKLIFPS